MPQSDEFIQLTDINNKPFFVQVKTISAVINAEDGNTRLYFKVAGQKGLTCKEPTSAVHLLIKDADERYQNYLLELAQSRKVTA